MLCTLCVLQASLASLRAEWSAELAALKADVEHKRRMAAATLKARQEEEDIKVTTSCMLLVVCCPTYSANTFLSEVCSPLHEC